jgi:hypothetical protein
MLIVEMIVIIQLEAQAPQGILSTISEAFKGP